METIDNNGEARILWRLTEAPSEQPWHEGQVSISPTFYSCLFHMKVFCATFLYLKFGFKFFWQKNIGAKAADKMLMKLTTGADQS